MGATIANVDGGCTIRLFWLRPLLLSTSAIATAIAAIDVNAGTVTGVTIAVATSVIETPARTARGGDVGRMRATITMRATSHHNGQDCESSKDNAGGRTGGGVGRRLPPSPISMVDAQADCFDEVCKYMYYVYFLFLPFSFPSLPLSPLSALTLLLLPCDVVDVGLLHLQMMQQSN